MLFTMSILSHYGMANKDVLKISQGICLPLKVLYDEL